MSYIEKRVELPFNEPEIRGYLYYAYNLIALSNYGNYKDWLYSNFIQVSCDDKYLLGMNATIWDTTLYECVSKIELLNISPKDINIFFKNALLKGYYVYTCVDEFYIPGKLTYKKEPLYHEIILLGYDETSKTYDTLGYNQDMIFTKQKVDFENFKEAFIKTDVEDTIVTLFPTKNLKEFTFNISDIKDMLVDYVTSTDSTKRLNLQFIDFYIPTLKQKQVKNKQVYGLQVYDLLTEYFHKLKSDEVELDSRQLHLLWEHKVCMKNRLYFLYDKGYLKTLNYSNEYEIIQKKFLVLRNMLLKYKLSKDSTIIDRIIKELSSLKVIEAEVLNKVIDDLEAIPT